MSVNNSVPKLAKSLTKPQIIHVAAVMFELPLPVQAKVAVLRQKLEEAMRGVAACENEACRTAGYPTGPCNPDGHLFTPSQYMVPSNNGGNSTLEEICATEQSDVLADTSLESDGGLNPRADSLEQRRELLTATLAQQGLQLSDLADLFPPQRQEDLPAASASPRVPPRPTPRSVPTSAPSTAGGGGRAPLQY